MRGDTSSELGDPPGPSGLPVVGSTFEYAADPLAFMTRCARDHGDVVSLDIARLPMIQLNHPDHIRYVLVENNQSYRKGEFFQRELSVLGNGLLNNEGESWRNQRHQIEPAFTPERLQNYASEMVSLTQRQCEQWEPGTTSDINRDFMGLTLQIVVSALFDSEITEQQSAIRAGLDAVMSQYRHSTLSVVPIPTWVPTPRTIRYRRAVEKLDEIVADLIQEQRQRDSDSTSVLATMLDATDVTEDGSETSLRGEAPKPTQMADSQIRDEILTLVLAGHETTSLALTYTLHLLARHPDIETRVLTELDAVLNGSAPGIRDVGELTVLERVIKESMRLYPPVQAIVREAKEPDSIGGYRIPAGKTLNLPQWVVHRHPEFYDDPDAFRPERWQPAAAEDRHPFAYFPFGAGPRRCLGERFAMLEAKLVLATTLQRYRFELVSSEELTFDPAITLRPAEPVQMRPHAR